MAYSSKELDFEKRRNQEGSYSLYNYLYHYLLDNYEPTDLASDGMARATKRLLAKEGRAYNMKGGRQMSEEELDRNIDEAMRNFRANDGRHGDTGHNLGKRHEGQFENIKRTLADLRW